MRIYTSAYLSRWLPAQTDPWNTILIATFLPTQPIYVLLNFLYSWFLHSFTHFHFLTKTYTTVIEIEKRLKFTLKDFTHLLCRHKTFVFVLKANLHTVDQLNLVTAKFGDFITLNILVMANFGLSGKLIFAFFSRPFGEIHISKHTVIHQT